MSKVKEKIRCGWCVGKQLYEQYHDEEWGKPVYDDQLQFEFLVLESAQAGLSWFTILQRREGYRKAFANFDYKKVAKYTDVKVEDLMQDTGIIRNRAKIKATINNAQRFQEIQKELGSFSNYIWSFVGGKPIVNKWQILKEVPATTTEAAPTSYSEDAVRTFVVGFTREQGKPAFASDHQPIVTNFKFRS